LRAEDATSASRLFGEAARLADEAAKIRTIPGATRLEGPIKVADGVLDTFIAEAPGLIYLPDQP
jgi:hyaluronoglucosaminidase